MASLMASFSVREPDSTPRTSAPSNRMRKTFSSCRRMSSVPMYHTFHPKQRAHGRRGDAVLAGASLGNDAMLAHAAGQQRLSDAVVDLVRAGVQQVFALEVDPRAAKFFRKPLRQEQRRRTAG